MSNDRVLLEFAAKAAGLSDSRWDDFYASISHTASNGLKDCPWNPITSDAEAFRLAVQFGMDLTLPQKREQVSAAAVWFDGVLIHKMRWLDDDAEESDFIEAARRNIVEVAAEIGKVML